jgi:hypothetical protein
MKALTLWQPWASAIVAGLKRNETRHWFTPYRGPIAIHAALISDADLQMRFAEKLERAGNAAAFARIGITCWDDLPLGKVVATAALVDCLHTDQLNFSLDSPEYEWGNYTQGRFAWMLDTIVPLPTPIAVKGMQGLWEWEKAS